MKKLAIAGMISILAILGLSGCGSSEPTQDATTPGEDTSMEETAPTNETSVSQKREIVETLDYKYNTQDGTITSVKDGEVLFTLENPNIDMLYLLGLEEKQLIVWRTGVDNSPGPCWNVWSSKTQADNVFFLDLDNTEVGLTNYVIPEDKVEEGEASFDNCMNQMFGEEDDEPQIEGGGGVHPDEDPSNYPSAPAE
ncbi:hypothetical protein ACFL3C_01135 [Patescibacteria group bacterium]